MSAPNPWALPPPPVTAPRRRLVLWPWALAGTVLAWLPLLSVLLCAALAGALDCRVDEGSAHPCVVAGQDIGPLLYFLGMMGWLMLLTAPLMLASIVLWLGVAGRWLWRRWRAGR